MHKGVTSLEVHAFIVSLISLVKSLECVVKLLQQTLSHTYENLGKCLQMDRKLLFYNLRLFLPVENCAVKVLFMLRFSYISYTWHIFTKNLAYFYL